MILKQPILRFDNTEHSFLSNFYPARFVWRGLTWDTSEHAYQAAKALHHSDFLKISQAATPGIAKRMGKQIQLISNWEDVKIDVMEQIVGQKFRSNPDLMNKLIETYPAHLEEGNTWHDRFWGVCPPGSGNGRNELGKVLMRIRDDCMEDVSGRREVADE